MTRLRFFFLLFSILALFYITGRELNKVNQRLNRIEKILFPNQHPIEP